MGGMNMESKLLNEYMLQNKRELDELKQIELVLTEIKQLLYDSNIERQCLNRKIGEIQDKLINIKYQNR